MTRITLAPKQLSYESVYDANYFNGKKSFFYRLTGGYRDLARVFDGYAADVRRHCDGGRLLDVGCAYGFLLRRFEGDFETFGVDVSEHAIEQARLAAPGSQLRVHNVLEPLPFADQSFDVVTITDLLEHVPGTPGILAEVARVLRPGGILYITTPNRTPWRRVIFGVADVMEHHVNLLSYRELGRFLDQAGFDVVERFTSLSAAVLGWRFSGGIGLEQTYIARRRA
jgi:2-polyprenyl-3-methyl-5-hydroxy-6-metoxy-1,4-benzoquinol methylase